MSQLRCNSIVPVGGIPAGASGGGIVQCVQTTSSTSVISTSTTYASTGLSASITPRSTSNKILVMVNLHGNPYSSNVANLGVQLSRNASPIYTTDVGFIDSVNAAINIGTYISFNHLDSPSTTSSITYSLEFNGRIISGPNGNYVAINYTTSGYVTSYLTLMEISG